MHRLSLHNTLMRHKNTRQSNHKFRWRVRKGAVMLNWDPSDLRQKAQRGVSDDVVGPRPGESAFWGIMESTISTIINLACLLACPSHWLGVNNIFVIVTGAGRKDTVSEIVPNTWKSHQREQIDMSSKCCCQTSKMQDKMGALIFFPKPQHNAVLYMF